MREQSKMSALFMTKNTKAVSMELVEKSESFASAIGAESVEFRSEKIVIFFRVKLKRKFIKQKKKTKITKKKNTKI